MPKHGLVPCAWQGPAKKERISQAQLFSGDFSSKSKWHLSGQGAIAHLLSWGRVSHIFSPSFGAPSIGKWSITVTPLMACHRFTHSFFLHLEHSLIQISLHTSIVSFTLIHPTLFEHVCVPGTMPGRRTTRAHETKYLSKGTCAVWQALRWHGCRWPPGCASVTRRPRAGCLPNAAPSKQKCISPTSHISPGGPWWCGGSKIFRHRVRSWLPKSSPYLRLNSTLREKI